MVQLTNFRAGTGRVDITPPIGSRMQGYASRDHGAEGIHDRLSATAIVMDDGDTMLAIVTCDLIGLDKQSVDNARREAFKICGIDPGAIMINCSHTHGGPATSDRSYVGAEKAYLRMLERQIGTAVAIAVMELRSSNISIGRGSVRIGVNRRGFKDGRMTIGVNPKGPIDPEVLAVRIDDDEGKTFGLIFNHSCHGTTLGGDNYLITADYIGYARGTIEDVLRDHSAMSAFVNGAAGNINPHPRGTFDLARRHGMALGAEVLVASQKAEPIKKPTLAYANLTADLPLSTPPPREQLDNELEELETTLREAKGRYNPGTMAQVLWRREMICRIETDSVKDSIGVDIQALRIGPLGVAAIPGEVFVEIGLEIKKRSPLAYNMVAGYTNGNIGYIPTAKAFHEGGYEPNSHIYLIEQKFDPGVGDVVKSSAISALEACIGN